jgi:hypothetical protein
MHATRRFDASFCACTLAPHQHVCVYVCVYVCVQVDIYSMALIFFFICNGTAPWDYVSGEHVRSEVARQDMAVCADAKTMPSPQLASVVEKMLHHTPSARPHASTLVTLLTSLELELGPVADRTVLLNHDEDKGTCGCTIH